MKLHKLLHKLITLEQITQIRVKNSNYIHVNKIAIKIRYTVEQ